MHANDGEPQHPAPSSLTIVNFAISGPADDVAFGVKAIEGVLDMLQREGMTVAPLGEANKMERIFAGQNQLDNRLRKQRRLLYPQDVTLMSREELGAWHARATQHPLRDPDADDAHLGWMHYFHEGVVAAFLAGRLSREKLEDLIYGVWMNQHAQAAIHEAVEIQAATSWKHWTNHRPPDRENIQEELIDGLHFGVSGMLKSGMVPLTVLAAYEKKNAQNHARQDGVVAGREDYKARTGGEKGGVNGDAA